MAFARRVEKESGLRFTCVADMLQDSDVSVYPCGLLVELACEAELSPQMEPGPVSSTQTSTPLGPWPLVFPSLPFPSQSGC